MAFKKSRTNTIFTMKNSGEQSRTHVNVLAVDFPDDAKVDAQLLLAAAAAAASPCHCQLLRPTNMPMLFGWRRLA